LAAAADAEQVMENGQLILSYQHTVQPRATELAIPELGRTIPLDVALSPAENADRAFHRYRKLRDARVRIPTLLEAAEAEVARLEDIAAFTRLAGSEGELRELERAIAPSRERAAPGRRREKRRGPVRYRYDGHTAIVGRNAAENEEVTFRLARREDTWLHARGRTGAHVILQTPEELPTDAVIEAAARLAAYFSEGRSDAAVDVDVTRARDVRKIAGGPPGRVTYRNERTLRVQPQISGWDSSG
ncbi:MAG TPA: NFACT RNA binding domain-containing protein, partial [Chloroflexota bacterium]